MSSIIDSYINYVSTVRRYSPRTAAIYRDSLEGFEAFCREGCAADPDIVAFLTPQCIRSYEVRLLDDGGLDSRTVNLHLSVLSGFCRFLMMEGRLESNPVRLVTRPKMSKRLPEFFRDDAMREYFDDTEHGASEAELEILASFGDNVRNDKTAVEMYGRRLRRMIVSLLFSTGIRRAELISLTPASVDMSRRMIKVRGKGDKEREVPMVEALRDELALYRKAVKIFFRDDPCADASLLLTPSGKPLYPVFVDRAVKQELGSEKGVTGRKSPHVLRHTLATELLNEGSDLYSIKELLGHSSLAATQVYTHNSIEKLKNVYNLAHPRAKEK